MISGREVTASPGNSRVGQEVITSARNSRRGKTVALRRHLITHFEGQV